GNLRRIGIEKLCRFISRSRQLQVIDFRNLTSGYGAGQVFVFVHSRRILFKNAQLISEARNPESTQRSSSAKLIMAPKITVANRLASRAVGHEKNDCRAISLRNACITVHS